MTSLKGFEIYDAILWTLLHIKYLKFDFFPNISDTKCSFDDISFKFVVTKNTY